MHPFVPFLVVTLGVAAGTGQAVHGSPPRP